MLANGSGLMTGSIARAQTGIVARPTLFERLSSAARVTVVSGPPGSGKTVLLRSWIDEAGLTSRAGWVSMGHNERGPQRFWLSVVGALRRTAPGAELVQALTAAPDMDGWAVVEQLLKDLAPLREPIWLALDDVHELGSTDALRQLELLVLRGPGELRFVLVTRHELRMGLHRLRLEGALTEIRASDLRFGPREAHELLTGAGVRLSESATAALHARTEGWAAGVRLAALSLAGHPDPERLAAEFSGSERTVAEYLLAEVLDRQPEHVRRLLLCTSILESVNGELADLLTADQGGERILQNLEHANAFVVAQDAGRSWFRYHQMFADLLRLELRRTFPAEVAGLHRVAAEWLAGHGCPAEAIRHAQAARDWDVAVRMLADHWTGLHLDGQAAVAHELLLGFSADARAANAELAALAASDELAHGAADSAQWYLDRARRGSASVPDSRQERLQVLLCVVRLVLARQRGELSVVAEQARRMEALGEASEPARAASGDDLRAFTLINLGIAEIWDGRFADADDHLRRGLALARRIGRPYLEFIGLAYVAVSATQHASEPDARCSAQAMDLARRHGWMGDTAAGIASVTLAVELAWQGRLAEAEPHVQLAERVIRAETDPSATLGVRYGRGLLELARGRHAEALAAFQAAESLTDGLAAPHYLLITIRAQLTLTLLRLGEIGAAAQAVAQVDEQASERVEMRVAIAALAHARDDPRAALAALAPILDGTAVFAGLFRSSWRIQALLLEAIARDQLGERSAAERSVERALDVAEPDGWLTAFLLHPVRQLIERHSGYRTTHAALIIEILGLSDGTGVAPPLAGPEPLAEPLSESELRVLRYLPTNLTALEIAEELSVSRNTIKTHMRHLYGKLGTHRRTEAVDRARALGLLAPSARPQPGGGGRRISTSSRRA